MLEGRGDTTVFGAHIEGDGVYVDGSYGLFLNSGSGNQPIVMVGADDELGPGMGPNRMFAQIQDFAVADDGMVIFTGLARDNVLATDQSGIWMYQNGVINNLLLEGQLISPDPESPAGSEVVSRIKWDQQKGFDRRHNRIIVTVYFESGNSSLLIIDVNIPGDLDGDGFVGIADLNSILPNWNQSVAPRDLLAGDVTGDGFVGIEDLNTVLGNWNAGTPPPPEVLARVPEPAAVCLLGVGLLGMVKSRKSGKQKNRK